MNSVKGIIANPKAGLIFKFQFNPHEMNIQKPVNYELRTPPGWDRPIIEYSNNGVKTIEFDIVADATDGSASTVNFQFAKPYGVRDVIATLESFMLPESPLDQMPMFDKRKFVAPPLCYFIFGLRWAKTVLAEAPIRETLYSSLTLTPQRLFSRLKFMVVEEGSAYELESVQRVILARAGAVTSAIGVVGNVGSTLAERIQ